MHALVWLSAAALAQTLASKSELVPDQETEGRLQNRTTKREAAAPKLPTPRLPEKLLDCVLTPQLPCRTMQAQAVQCDRRRTGSRHQAGPLSSVGVIAQRVAEGGHKGLFRCVHRDNHQIADNPWAPRIAIAREVAPRSPQQLEQGR
jgi:hypothetical protein